MNLSSLNGLRVDPGMSAYGSAKAALIALTEGMALELIESGVQVVCIAGNDRYTCHLLLLAMKATQKHSLRLFPVAGTALLKVAAAILFLASQDAPFIVGANLVIDGGATFESRQPDLLNMFNMKPRYRMTSFSGLTAIVTGAAGAMGEQEARMFAERGANVLTDVRADEKVIADDIGKSAVFVPHDVSSESGWNTVIETALSAFGSVNVLVNNAAISKAIKLIDTDVDTLISSTASTNGVYLGMKSVVEPMKAVGGKLHHQYFVGCRASRTDPDPCPASKWAVRGVTQSEALNLPASKFASTQCSQALSTLR